MNNAKKYMRIMRVSAAPPPTDLFSKLKPGLFYDPLVFGWLITQLESEPSIRYYIPGLSGLRVIEGAKPLRGVFGREQTSPMTQAGSS